MAGDLNWVSSGVVTLSWMQGLQALSWRGADLTCAPSWRSDTTPYSDSRSRVLARAAAVEFSRAASSMDRLHIELLATRPLDFRDAPCFAATCTVARTAILSGPLLLWTESNG